MRKSVECNGERRVGRRRLRMKKVDGERGRMIEEEKRSDKKRLGDMR